MPFNGTGIFQRVYNWVNDAANGIFVDATRTDTDTDDIADGLSNCVTRDGQSTPFANLPMGNFKFTGLGAGSNNTDSVNYGQVFNQPTFIKPMADVSPTDSDNPLRLATVGMVNQRAFSLNLPAQGGNAGKFLRTDGTNAFWDMAGTVNRQVRTANTNIVAADRSSLIDVTTGGFTQTFDAPASLGTGWWLYYRNNSLDDITIPLSDGVSNWIMYPGEVRLFQCDGTALTSFVINPFKKDFPASGNFIKPPGYSTFDVELWGAGGGGGGAGITGGGSGAGGAGGGYWARRLLASELASTTSVLVGIGGNGGNGTTNASGSGNAGSAGGTSSFGLLMSSAGGGGGVPGTAQGGSNPLYATQPYTGANGTGSLASDNGTAGNNSAIAGASGASGGGSANGNVGGAGGVRIGKTPAAGGTSATPAGGNGQPFCGGGGGSGGIAGIGGQGGDGGASSGGGGGGIGSTRGGNGGKGGDGFCTVKGV